MSSPQVSMNQRKAKQRKGQIQKELRERYLNDQYLLESTKRRQGYNAPQQILKTINYSQQEMNGNNMQKCLNGYNEQRDIHGNQEQRGINEINGYQDMKGFNEGLQFCFDQQLYHNNGLNHLKDSGDSLLDALIKIQANDFPLLKTQTNDFFNNKTQNQHFPILKTEIYDEFLNHDINKQENLIENNKKVSKTQQKEQFSQSSNQNSKKRSHPLGSKISLQTKSSLNSQSNTSQNDNAPYNVSTLAYPCTWKQRKLNNQHIYSKNYRQKKKQQFKILEEENNFLKKKINELQNRIRDIEHELNRIKHDPINSFDMTCLQTRNSMNLNKKQKNALNSKDKKSVQNCYGQNGELNYSWLQKINEILQKEPLINEETLHQQFALQYDTYGFAGKQKIQKLKYHMNQFLQNILKDSEKYLALTVINDQGLLGDSPDHDYPQTNYTMFEIMEYDTQKLELVKKFLKPFMKPTMEKLLQACQKLHTYFDNVFNQIYRTHEYLKKSKDRDFLTIKQRLQMQNYFQSNKYTKQLRKIKQDWIQTVKNQKEEQNYENNKKKLNRQFY